MLIDFRKLFQKHNIKPTGVLHLGANIGEEAHIYDQLGIKKVLWVEANPEIFILLKNNIKQYSEQKAFCFCAGNHNKNVKFHVSNNGSQSSSVLELGTHKQQHPDVHYVEDIEVSMMRIESLFNKIGIEKSDEDYDLSNVDFLNCDLQGYEMEAIKGMGNFISQFKWIYSEVNKAEVYKGCPHVNDFDLFLNGFGFKRVETANWIGDWTDALYIKK